MKTEKKFILSFFMKASKNGKHSPKRILYQLIKKRKTDIM